MPPFFTHLVIAERIFPTLSMLPAEVFGDFLFGCLAPDVDKFVDGMDQATTHFVPKDPSERYMEARSLYFIEHHSELLRRPYLHLNVHERAFVLGYLCHLASDEGWSRHMLAFRHRVTSPLRALLTALDEIAQGELADLEGDLAALARAEAPDVLTFVSTSNLQRMQAIVWPFLRAGGGVEAFLEMARRSDVSGGRVLELQHEMMTTLDRARVEAGRLEALVAIDQAVERSRAMLAQFLAVSDRR